MKQRIYYISGMRCASCELLIEKRFLEEDNVRAADASIGNGTVVVTYEGKLPKTKALNYWFKKDGYTLSDQKIKTDKDPMIYFVDGKGIQVDKKIFYKKIKTLGSIVLVFSVLYLLEGTGAGRYVSVNESSSLGIFFLFGLVAGLSSCAALVGGLILSLSKSWNENLGHEASPKQKIIPHLYFNSGRLFMYTLLGGVLGALGKAMAFENVTVYALITIIVSIVMLFVGLQMAGVSCAERFQVRFPKWISRNIVESTGKSDSHVPFVVGAGTIFLPCGFTLVAQGLALASGSAVRGALILMFFVLGTMIPLLFIGYVSIRGTANPKRGKLFSYYAGIVLVMFALYNVNGQLNVLGMPSASGIFEGEKVYDSEKTDVDLVAGEQIVNVVAKGFNYRFTGGNTIKANIPTKLVVDNQGILGCGAFIVSQGLFGGYVELKQGKNIIDIGKPKKGIYKITCSMGMVTPITLKVI